MLRLFLFSREKKSEQIIKILSAISLFIKEEARESEYTKPEQPWFISNASEFFFIPSLSWIKQALVGKGFVGDWLTYKIPSISLFLVLLIQISQM